MAHEPAPEGHRFYGELAEWWPLISPVEEYAEEGSYFARLLAELCPAGSAEVLELGSGGGHVAFYLRDRFRLTLVDLSPDMLEVSRRLNPGLEHLVGDMRTVRLERRFDAVFVHDAVAYMATEADLTLAMATAFEHCRPGGVAVFAPDCTSETFEPSTDHGGVDDETTGRAARYLEWSWDPDPTDGWAFEEFAFLLRSADGTVEVAHETHRWGLFGREVWLRLLGEAGFEVSSTIEETVEDRTPREIFIGRRPHPR